MTVLVTGSAGLIGTRVVRKLLADGHEVVHQDIRPPAREFNQGPGKLYVIVSDGDGAPPAPLEQLLLLL